MSVALEGINPPLRIVPEVPMSREEFWRFSAGNPELRMERAANGELIVMTPTRGRSGPRNAEIIRQLGNWAVEDFRGTLLESNSGCELPDGSILCPDTGWVSFSRWTPPASEEADAAIPCPEFVIELRSNTDRLKPSREKMELWMANGCELAWLIDPSRKAVEVYRPRREVEVLEGGSVVEGEGPVAGFVLELRKVWG
jgi:Uma2 family endonuclease